MSDHVKGPWYVGAMNDATFIIDQPPRPSNDDINPNQDASVIAKICDPGRKGDEHANLIAASPGLLAMLRRVRETCHLSKDESLGPDIDKLIAKATTPTEDPR